MKSLKKVLHIATPFLPVRKDMGYGSIERIVADLVKEESKSHEFEVFLAGPEGTYIEEAKAIKETIPPIGIPGSYLSSNHSTYAVLKHVSEVMRFAEEIKPDISHFHDDYLFAFMDLISPSVMTLHSRYEDFWDFSRYSAENGQEIVAISKRQKEIYAAQGINASSVIYNGINTEDYAFSENSLDYMLSLGAIRPEKGQDTAIEIFEEVKTKKDLDLIVAGNIVDRDFFNEKIMPRVDIDISSENDKIKAYRDAKKQKKEALVFYAGEVNDEQKIPLYQNAGLFLMPVKWEESFGMVVVEALSCGTPVLASNIGAMPEIITKDTGRLFDLGAEKKDIAEKAYECLNLSRENCRKSAEQNFSIRKKAEAYMKVYRRAIYSKSHFFI